MYKYNEGVPCWTWEQGDKDHEEEHQVEHKQKMTKIRKRNTKATYKSTFYENKHWKNEKHLKK